MAGSNVSTGGNHTLIGYSAGDSITDSVHNTAVGYEAHGASNGSYNTAIGDRALHLTNGGNDNVAIGSRAHYGSANSATRNTVVGVSSMEGATTGSYNSALGMRALYLNSSGTENTAMGYLAMDANTTGSYNVGLGVNALGGNTTANYNTAIGTGAMIACTEGHSNVAIGASCGDGITTGDENICIGYLAGDNITTQNANITIGHGTIIGNSNNHCIVIGHDIGIDGNFFAFGKASNYVYNGFTSNNSWTRNSDVRLKKNISTNTLGLDFINALRPVTFNWKDSRELDSTDAELADHYNADENLMDSTTLYHGFIAQEVKTAMDNAGISNFGGWNKLSTGVQGVSLEAMVTPLVRALQEADDKIEALTARVATLEG